MPLLTLPTARSRLPLLTLTLLTAVCLMGDRGEQEARIGEAAERPVSKAVARIFGRLVDPAETTIVKLMPTSPPLRGTIVLVDDVRCRVTRAKVTWDGPRWTIRSLRVKEAS